MVYGVVTPTGCLTNLLGHLVQLSLTGHEQRIATVVGDIVPQLTDLGRSDLGARLTKVQQALQDGGYVRSDWHKSALFGKVKGIYESLKRGTSLPEALQLQDTAHRLQDIVGPTDSESRSLAARLAPPSLGPDPIIAWERYGTEQHLAPEPPDDMIKAPGLLLGWFAQYVAGTVEQTEKDVGVERFFDISNHTRVQLREGKFISNKAGHFPTEISRRLIIRATAIEPLWGELMQELAILSAFEAYNWSLGVPDHTTAWDESFLYGLRQYFVTQLLSVSGREQVLKDKPLKKLIFRKNSLETVRWHQGHTRRDVFQTWLEAMSGGNPQHLVQRQRYIGNGLLRDMRWHEPPDNSAVPLKDQWLARYWTCHFHYGALPARGLFTSTATLVRFVTARNLVAERHYERFQAGLYTMFGNFFTPEEVASKKLRRAA